MDECGAGTQSRARGAAACVSGTGLPVYGRARAGDVGHAELLLWAAEAGGAVADGVVFPGRVGGGERHEWEAEGARVCSMICVCVLACPEVLQMRWWEYCIPLMYKLLP